MFLIKQLLFLTLMVHALAEDYILPTIYAPSNYDISITVTSDAFTNSSYQYNAAVTITFTVSEVASEIQLHANPAYISFSSVIVNSVAATSYVYNNVTDIATIVTASQLAVNQTHSLVIQYVGTLSIDDMYGFYRSSYTDSNGTTSYLLSTQFESTRARRAFPCFDEPQYKATFDLTLTYPAEYSAISNMGINSTTSATTSTTTTFNTTPKMSTYLLAYVISDFTCTDNTLNDQNLTHSVCSRNDTLSSREWALEIGPQVIDVLNNYTGFPYSNSMTKLHQFAIPDFAAGAMENWGLVTYREVALLYDTSESSASYQEYVAAVIAHELAHQWFGNLVTMKWWSVTFLNEGFATFFEYYVPNEVLPSFEYAKKFVIEILHGAFSADSYTTSQSLESNASTQSEIQSKFGTLTYNKGGSVLRMVENFLGHSVFQAGVQNYLNAYQYSNTEPDNLWEILNAAASNITGLNLPTDLSTIMSNWIKNSGYPIVCVSYNSNTSEITVTQQRFLFSGNDTESKWYIPISFTTSGDTSQFENTLASHWLIPSNTSTTISYNSTTSNWIIFNNKQTGYYRVNYDTNLWSQISQALLQSNFSNIPDENRAQIVSDAFNLVRANYLSYSKVYEIIAFLTNDTEYFSWYAAFEGFDYLLRRVGLDTALGTSIANHLLDLSKSLRAARLLTSTNSSDHMYTINQYLTNSWACKLGDENCTTTALQLFAEYKNTSVRPNKDLRAVIYCTAIRESTNVSVDWDYLWSAYQDTSIATEKLILLSSLGCAKDTTILSNYLLKTITDNSGIRSQDSSSVFSAVYRGSANGVNVALDFFINNYDSIVEKYTSFSSVGNLIKNIAEYFTTEEQLTKLNAFLNSTNDTELAPFGSEAIEIVQNNFAWMALFQDDLVEYYGLNKTTPASNTTDAANATTPAPVTNATTSAPTAAPGAGIAINTSPLSVILTGLMLMAVNKIFKI